MPIHDWTKVGANRFHDFHFSWTGRIRDALNGGLLPNDYFALAEQHAGPPQPDVLTLKVPYSGPSAGGGLLLLDAPVKTRHVAVADVTRYAQKANRIKIHEPDGDVVAIIEIISPGNKDSQHAIKSFTRKIAEFIDTGIHVLMIDLFPPSKRDRQGIHPLIWRRIQEEDFTLPRDKPLTLASYNAGVPTRAFVEPVAVGDALPDMPIFLTGERYVNCPLETTYQSSWNVYPRVLKAPLEVHALLPLE